MKTPQEVAQEAELASKSIEYPKRPAKPIKASEETHAEYGRRMDWYEQEALPRWKIDNEECRLEQGRINETFRRDLIASLGLTGKRNADKLYNMAYERGHSNGYEEVALIAQELAELLE